MGVTHRSGKLQNKGNQKGTSEDPKKVPSRGRISSIPRPIPETVMSPAEQILSHPLTTPSHASNLVRFIMRPHDQSREYRARKQGAADSQRAVSSVPPRLPAQSSSNDGKEVYAIPGFVLF